MDEHGCCCNFTGFFNWHHSQLAAATPRQSRARLPPWLGSSRKLRRSTIRRCNVLKPEFAKSSPKPFRRLVARCLAQNFNGCLKSDAKKYTPNSSLADDVDSSSRHRNWRDADGAKKKHILHNFVKLLAHAKPDKHQLQHFVASTLINRGTALLTHTAVQALAVSLFDHDSSHLTNVESNGKSATPLPRGTLWNNPEPRWARKMARKMATFVESASLWAPWSWLVRSAAFLLALIAAMWKTWKACRNAGEDW